MSKPTAFARVLAVAVCFAPLAVAYALVAHIHAKLERER